MKGENRGATTIIVVCIMAVVTALSMGLFLTASVLTRNATRTLAGEQCRILAVSFSREVEQMLTSPEYESEDLLESSIGYYVKQNISDGSWPYFDEAEGGIHSRENSVRSFWLEQQGTVSEVTDLTLQLYWSPGTEGETPIQLTVETTAEVKGQSCTILDIYELQTGGYGEYDRWSWKHVEKK